MASKLQGSLERALAPSSSSSQLSDELAAALVADVVGMGWRMGEEGEDYYEVPLVGEQEDPLYVPRMGTPEQERELDESIWKALMEQLKKNKETEEEIRGLSHRRG